MRLFDWDQRKAAANERKHGVSFEQAMEAFEDANAVVMADDDHSDDEELRERLIGLSSKGVLLVVFVVRDHDDGDVKRIISARKATRKEKEVYATTHR